jgi:CBS domain-containing protein
VRKNAFHNPSEESSCFESFEAWGDNMTIARILDQKGSAVHTVSPETSILDAVAKLALHRVGALLACGADGTVQGVFSERDVVRALAKIGPEMLAQPVSSLMTTKLYFCALTDTVQEAMALMTQNRIRHLPVMDGGSLKGMVSIGDLVKARIEQSEIEAAALKDYISAS